MMSALSRFGPVVARSMLAQQHRQMASASVAGDPIQKLFVDRIREIKTSNKGLDATHENQLKEEMLRLKRVFSVEDESKLSQIDHKFSPECDISLRDIDSSKEMREKIQSGDYQRQLAVQTKAPSAVLATTPDQTQHDMCLPPMNKPDPQFLLDHDGVPEPAKVVGSLPDYQMIPETMTPHKLERQFNVHFGEHMPTIHDDGPQRDKVNFPRINQMMETPPTRYHIIPESWFQFFYSKTGVTGPYTFAAAFGTFLLSKELLVVEHEFLTGLSSICIFAWAIPKFGPAAKKSLVDGMNKQIEDWDRWQKGNSEALAVQIDHYKQQFSSGELIDELYNARKQDVEQQLEAEYRARLKKIYDDTKRRLNYLVAVANSQRQIHHANMVSMVISNVLSSFGPKQEAEVLDDCIVNLKGLAKRHQNAI